VVPSDPSLHAAVRSGDLDRVKRLVGGGANVNERGNTGMTPLAMAVCDESLKVVKLLLSHGANANARDDFDRTPLTLVATSRNDAIIRLLIKRGAGVYDRTYRFWYDLGKWTEEQPSKDVLLTVKSKKADLNRAFFRALAAGGPDLYQATALLWLGADPHSREPHGERTTLIMAMQAGLTRHSVIVPWLLKAGVDVNAKDKSGYTALIQAAMGGMTGEVKLLLERGAKASATTTDGMTALKYAQQNGHKDVVDVLMRASN
jgi:ankyrin repeat protein